MLRYEEERRKAGREKKEETKGEKEDAAIIMKRGSRAGSVFFRNVGSDFLR